MKSSELINIGSKLLREKKIDSHKLDTEIILSHILKVKREQLLIREKETPKDFIKENILKIKSDIETNSLESHLTRIRKKMNKIKTIVKIQTKGEKLLITT